MTLREELEDRADKLDAELLDLSGRIKEIERQSNELHTCLNALDIAEMDAEDAALEPALIVNTDEGWELEPETQAGVEIPEGFTKWEGGKCPLPVGTRFDMICRACGPWHDMEVLADSSLEWQHTGRDLDVIAYRIIEASPTSEDQPDDEASRAAAIELTADVEPEIQALIESGEHSYDEVAAIAYPTPQWNEPQPTEGYAPVTNPEADTIARAYEYYSPEKMGDRNRSVFDIFRHKREDA